MAEATKPSPFGGAWVYNKAMESKLCTERSAYEALKQEGWKDSPADFGIETHPTNPVQQVSMGTGVSLPGAPPAQDLATAGVMQALADLTTLLTSVQGLVDQHTQMLGAVNERVQALEMMLTHPPASASGEPHRGDEPTAPRGGRRLWPHPMLSPVP